MHILIVDDQAANRVMLKGLIERFGHNVSSAENGMQALELFSHKGADIVLLDVMMPVMDGLTTAKHLKQLSGEIHLPVLFITALDDQKTLLECLDAGGDDFISTPPEPIVLQAKLNAHARVRELSFKLKEKNEVLAYHSNRMEREQNVVSHMLSNALLENELRFDFLQTYLSPATEFNGDLVLSKGGPLGNYYIFVGDFTGHGLAPATGALPVAQTFFDLAEKGLSVATMVKEFNRRLVKLLPDDMFCAAFVAELSAGGDRLSYWNGGIPDALFIDNNGEVTNRLPSEHLALGILPPDEFNSSLSHCFIERGQRLVAYTDGVIEMANTDGNRLKESGFENKLKQFGHQDQFDDLVSSLESFQQGTEQSDDISLVVVNCVPTGLPVKQDDHSIIHLPFELKVSLTEHNIKGEDPVTRLVDSLSHLEGIKAHKTTLYLLLAEAFNNILEHNLLRLNSDIKEEDEGFERYYSERERRLESLEDIEVAIDVNYQPVDSVICFGIRSNGENGYPADEFSPVLDEEKMHGRGMQLIKNFSRYYEWKDEGQCLYIEYDLNLPSV